MGSFRASLHLAEALLKFTVIAACGATETRVFSILESMVYRPWANRGGG